MTISKQAAWVRSRTIRPIVALAILLAMVWPTFCAANPTSMDPSKSLVVHDAIPGSKAIASSAYSLYAQQEKAVVDYFERKVNPAKLPPGRLSKDCGRLWKARRDATDLQNRGEPAGFDLAPRLRMVHRKLRELTLRGDPRYRSKMVDQLKRETQKRERFLAQQSQLIDSGQLERSLKAMEAFGTKLEEQTCFLSPTVRGKYAYKFDALLSTLDTKLLPKTRTAYQQQARQAINNNSKKIIGFAAEASRVANEVASKGTFTPKAAAMANSDVAAGNGPADAIKYLCGEWGQASAALIRNVAIQWAFTRGSAASVNKSMRPQAAELETTAKAAIVNVINGAALTTKPEDVSKVYAAILTELSVIDRRMAGYGISQDCEDALQKFAAKNPGFEKQVAAYQRVTVEPLRWRERFAAIREEVVKDGYRPATQLLAQTRVIEKTNRPPLLSRVSVRKQAVAATSLGLPTHWLMYETGNMLVGERVSESNMRRISEKSLTAVIPFQERHYSNVAVGMPIEDELDDLRTCLMIDDDHPPLTIAAAGAISSALSQEFEEVGGAISRMHLEATVTRFVTLPDIAYSLTSLGRLPSAGEGGTTGQRICWRLDIEPHWVRHKYFVVAIPSKLPPAKN